ncbi:MAG: hypothetical protein Q9160_005134 [Pyrenula sp. 1 TL-2023]
MLLPTTFPLALFLCVSLFSLLPLPAISIPVVGPIDGGPIIADPLPAPVLRNTVNDNGNGNSKLSSLGPSCYDFIGKPTPGCFPGLNHNQHSDASSDVPPQQHRRKDAGTPPLPCDIDPQGCGGMLKKAKKKQRRSVSTSDEVEPEQGTSLSPPGTVTATATAVTDNDNDSDDTAKEVSASAEHLLQPRDPNDSPSPICYIWSVFCERKAKAKRQGKPNASVYVDKPVACLLAPWRCPSTEGRDVTKTEVGKERETEIEAPQPPYKRQADGEHGNPTTSSADSKAKAKADTDTTDAAATTTTASSPTALDARDARYDQPFTAGDHPIIYIPFPSLDSRDSEEDDDNNNKRDEGDLTASPILDEAQPLDLPNWTEPFPYGTAPPAASPTALDARHADANANDGDYTSSLRLAPYPLWNTSPLPTPPLSLFPRSAAADPAATPHPNPAEIIPTIIPEFPFPLPLSPRSAAADPAATPDPSPDPAGILPAMIPDFPLPFAHVPLPQATPTSPSHSAALTTAAPSATATAMPRSTNDGDGDGNSEDAHAKPDSTVTPSWYPLPCPIEVPCLGSDVFTGRALGSDSDSDSSSTATATAATTTASSASFATRVSPAAFATAAAKKKEQQAGALTPRSDDGVDEAAASLPEMPPCANILVRPDACPYLPSSWGVPGRRLLARFSRGPARADDDDADDDSELKSQLARRGAGEGDAARDGDSGGDGDDTARASQNDHTFLIICVVFGVFFGLYVGVLPVILRRWFPFPGGGWGWGAIAMAMGL